MPEPARTWGLAHAAGGFLAGLFATSLVAGLWVGADGGGELDLLGRAVAQVAFWTGLVGSAVLACRRYGTGRLSTDLQLRIVPSDVWVGILAGLVAHRIVLPLVAIVLQPLLGHPDVGAPVRDLIDDTRGPAVVGLFLFVVLGAAVVEELYFRGLVMQALSRWGTAVAMGGSSIFFGVTHIQDGVSGAGLVLVITSLTVLALVLAGLRLRTGRLGAPIVAHATFNLTTLLLVI